jgi:putative iron-regulated protein
MTIIPNFGHVIAFILFVSTSAGADSVAIPEAIGKKVVEKYSNHVVNQYSSAIAKAQDLQTAIEAFTSKPSESSLTQAKEKWKIAKLSYAETEVFRFYGGPIDDPKDGVENFLNAWPIDESYLDYVKGNPKSGLIQNLKEFPEINEKTLLGSHVKNGERNISVGYHAIEFLLWGQDFSKRGPGQRSFKDYVSTKDTKHTVERRAKVLNLLSALVVKQLTQVRDTWTQGESKTNFTKKLKNDPLNESLRQIFTGFISLSIDEMSGERMMVSLEKRDQENEQDCFSDLSLKDLMANQRGILAAYENSGLSELVAKVSPSSQGKIEAALRNSLEKLYHIPEPFDQTILSKKGSPAYQKFEAAMDALQTQGKVIGEIGLKLGLILNI